MAGADVLPLECARNGLSSSVSRASLQVFLPRVREANVDVARPTSLALLVDQDQSGGWRRSSQLGRPPASYGQCGESLRRSTCRHRRVSTLSGWDFSVCSVDSLPRGEFSWCLWTGLCWHKAPTGVVSKGCLHSRRGQRRAIVNFSDWLVSLKAIMYGATDRGAYICRNVATAKSPQRLCGRSRHPPFREGRADSPPAFLLKESF